MTQARERAAAAEGGLGADVVEGAADDGEVRRARRVRVEVSGGAGDHANGGVVHNEGREPVGRLELLGEVPQRQGAPRCVLVADVGAHRPDHQGPQVNQCCSVVGLGPSYLDLGHPEDSAELFGPERTHTCGR